MIRFEVFQWHDTHSNLRVAGAHPNTLHGAAGNRANHIVAPAGHKATEL